MTSSSPVRGPAAAVAVLAVTVIGWALAAQHSPSVVLPSPAEVVTALLQDLARGTWWSAMSRTVLHVAVSVTLVITIGVVAGVAMGRSRLAEESLQVPVIVLRTVPTIAVAAIALLALGTGSLGVIAVTSLSALPYFTAGVAQGARDVDQGLIEMARAFGAPRPTILRSVVLPATVPHIVASTRVALGVSWHVAIVAEFLLGSRGVGARIAGDLRLLDTASVFAWGLSVVIITIAIEYGLLRPSEAWVRRD